MPVPAASLLSMLVLLMEAEELGLSCLRVG